MSAATALNAPIQRAARAISDLQTARHEIMAMAAPKWGPADKQAVLLSHMLARANDAIKDDFSRITMDQLPRYDVVLRDKQTGALVDAHTGRPL